MVKSYRNFIIVIDEGFESKVSYYELVKSDDHTHYESGEGVDKHDALRKAKAEIDRKYANVLVE